MRWDDDSGELAEYDALKDLILTLLPYEVDDGEDPPTEANAEECVEYAADEIKRLRSQNDALRAEVTRLRAEAKRADEEATTLANSDLDEDLDDVPPRC